MHKNPFPMTHIHLEMEKAIWDKLKKLHPNYGERSKIMRQLVAQYVLRAREHR